MGEFDYETTFIFRKPKDFWVHLNKQMVIQDRDTLNDNLYHLLFFETMPTDFNDWLDDNGCLSNRTGQITEGITDTTFHLGVEWIDNGENGFNLFLDEDEDVNIPIGENNSFFAKGVALAKVTGSDTGSDFIVAYSKPSTRIKCQHYVTLMKGTSFVGHSSCKGV